MPDHWEFATTKAHGRYILVLTDRSVLKQRALNRIFRSIVAQGEEIAVCSWRWSLFDDTKGALAGDMTGSNRGKVAVLDSENIASVFVSQSDHYPYALPRGLNGLLSLGLATD